MDDLAERVMNGERRAVARALTVVERRGPEARDLARRVWPATGGALRVGVTGPPGVGKSTLVDALAQHMKASGPVGVVAVDPSSTFSHGALLGDRIRMERSAAQDEVFIRSMASRGEVGGLAPATGEAADVLDAAGFKTIFVETVGVGQSEIEVASLADVTLVVMAPGAGDGIQALKAGVMEIADVFCVNKGDLPGADRVEADITGAIELAAGREGPPPPVLVCSAVDDSGVAALAGALTDAAAGTSPDALETRRRRTAAARLRAWLSHELRERLDRRIGAAGDVVDAVAARELSIADASERILKDMGWEDDA